MGVVSYGVKVNNLVKCLEPTLQVYRDAIRYLIDIVFIHYDEIKDLRSQEAQGYIEHLVHSTENNTAVYKKFDKQFYKFPSYLRRDAINTAIGKVKSYKKLVALWEENGCAGSKPRMNFNQDMMPCFYNGNMFKKDDSDGFLIKVYHKKDWVWLPITLRKTDLDYISKNCYGLDQCAPVLRKVNHGYMLQFGFKLPTSDKKFLKDKDVTRILSCDLGVNTDAVCTIMDKSGTVTGVKFINSKVEKDRLYQIVEKIKKRQSNGTYRNPKLWRFVDNYNTAIAVATARAIVAHAVKNKAEVIVFEHLSNFRGSRSQKVALWRKREIQHRVESMAERYGIRVSYVCAKNTSHLAFDGSGAVIRDKDNYSLCTFSSGKRYNCDLSAAKNIGARYFIRVILKSLKKKQQKQAEAKVPGLAKRTDCVLSTLLSLHAVVTAPAVAC